MPVTFIRKLCRCCRRYRRRLHRRRRRGENAAFEKEPPTLWRPVFDEPSSVEGRGVTYRCSDTRSRHAPCARARVRTYARTHLAPAQPARTRATSSAHTPPPSFSLALVRSTSATFCPGSALRAFDRDQCVLRVSPSRSPSMRPEYVRRRRRRAEAFSPSTSSSIRRWRRGVTLD